MRRHGWLWFPAVVAFAAAVLGIGVSSMYGAQAGVDEPQYLLSALSLAEDRDLDISDELAAERWRAFHADELPVQTEPLADGRQVSPHDPLLPLLVAIPMGLFGWVGVKVALGLLAGACAALLAWTAARRFGVGRRTASVGSALAFASPPLGVYSQQVYPEMPAALVSLAAVAALLTPRLRAVHVGVAVASVVALPWLSSKYAPVAVTLTVLLLARLWRQSGPRPVLWVTGGLGVAGVLYLVVHRAVWGGWTVYASGDHFQQTGEFSVVGVTPDYVGRSLRTVSLLVDQHFGLVPWQPAWLLLVPAVVAVVALRPRGWVVLLAPLAAAWATACWLALTMHGFWWPGRQVVVVLPLAALAVLWLVDRVLPRLRPVAAGLGLLGVANLAVLFVQGWQGTVTWVVHFQESVAPAYLLLGPVLPDYAGDAFLPGHVVWALVLLALGGVTWWHLRRRYAAPSEPEPRTKPALHTAAEEDRRKVTAR